MPPLFPIHHRLTPRFQGQIDMLLVEDNVDLQKSLKAELEKLTSPDETDQVVVHTAADLDTATDLLATLGQNVKALITDGYYPRFPGGELVADIGAQIVKAARNVSKSLPIIAMSSESSFGPKALAAGANAFFHKDLLMTKQLVPSILRTLREMGLPLIQPLPKLAYNIDRIALWPPLKTIVNDEIHQKQGITQQHLIKKDEIPSKATRGMSIYAKADNTAIFKHQVGVEDKFIGGGRIVQEGGNYFFEPDEQTRAYLEQHLRQWQSSPEAAA